jgi:MATE family multidrug resistance protein
VSALVIVAAHRHIPALFTADPGVRTLAAGLLLFAAVCHVPDGIQVGAAGALRGFKDAHVPMAFNFVSYWMIGFPVAWWLGIREGHGPRGIWVGLILGLFACAVLLSLRYRQVSNRAVSTVATSGAAQAAPAGPAI